MELVHLAVSSTDQSPLQRSRLIPLLAQQVSCSILNGPIALATDANNAAPGDTSFLAVSSTDQSPLQQTHGRRSNPRRRTLAVSSTDQSPLQQPFLTAFKISLKALAVADGSRSTTRDENGYTKERAREPTQIEDTVESRTGLAVGSGCCPMTTHCRSFRGSTKKRCCSHRHPDSRVSCAFDWACFLCGGVSWTYSIPVVQDSTSTKRASWPV